MKRVFGIVAALTVLLAGATSVFASEVYVQPTPAIIEFLADYGVTLEMLDAPRSELSRDEQTAVTAVLQEGVQDELNGLVYGALNESIGDEESIATMKVGSQVFRTGYIGEVENGDAYDD
jgi:hypothetical protein